MFLIKNCSFVVDGKCMQDIYVDKLLWSIVQIDNVHIQMVQLLHRFLFFSSVVEQGLE